MALRHTIYCKKNAATVNPQELLNKLETLDFFTLGEDYDIPADAIRAARPLRIENIDTGEFGRYRLSYGDGNSRPIEIHCRTDDVHRGAVAETIENLTIADGTRVKRISDFLQSSVGSVSVAFGDDRLAAMFAWEVVARYIATQFDGIIKANDGNWLRIASDYQAKPF